jgi:hypothetical protein
MSATLSQSAVETADQPARRRMQLAEGGPFLVSDRSGGIALHWLVDAPSLRALSAACGLAGSIPNILTPDLIDGSALVSLVVYRATTTRVAVGDRFAPWAVLEQPRDVSAWIIELRVAAEHTANDEAPEPCYITLALLSEDAVSAWVRPDKFAIACVCAQVALDITPDSVRLQIVAPDDASHRLVFSAKSIGEADATWADIPDAALHEADALLFARHTLDRLTMFTCARGLARRVSLWRRPQTTRTLKGIALDAASLPAALSPLGKARFIGAHLCDAVDGMWIGRPQCVAGPACSLAWREL